MSHTDDTPSPIPLSELAEQAPPPAPSNGRVEQSRSRVETGPIRASLVNATHNLDTAGAVGEQGPSAHDIATTLVQLMQGAGGGDGAGDGPKVDIHKELKRSNVWTLIFVALFGSGGIAASYYAVKARSESNERRIDQYEKRLQQHEVLPMHPDSNERVQAIETSVKQVKTDVATIRTGQKTIAEGIEQLKKEAQTDKQRRLEEKVRQLERENRRLERDRRPR